MLKLHNAAPKNLNHLFDDFFNELPAFGRTVNNLFAPPVNITETKDAYQLELLAPGRNKELFQVAIENGLLTIRYENKEEVKVATDANQLRKEFSLQNFKRSFSLDEKIQADKIEAKYDNGILYISLPKLEEVKPVVQTIQIK
jgi:HSP20 family protein